MVGNDENVLVEFDYNNIVLVDPNKIISSDGKISERLVKHENLVMYANLECDLLPRTRLNVSNSGNLSASKISVGRVNFMRPANKSFLTNQYTDEMVGGNVDNTVLKEESKLVDDKGEKIYDSELLLINSISIENQFSQQTVTIELEDVRGRALFEKGEDSPYAAFFNYPTPAFYLTVKGYYGKAAKFQLALQKFSARFNTATGNFSITCTFITYKFNILSRLFMDYLFSLPYMYERDYTISPTSDVNSLSSSNTAGNSDKGNVLNISTSYGRQKLHEVYSEYKSKELIDSSFPELSLQDLITKIDFLQTTLTNIFTAVELKPITDAENMNNYIRTFEQQVYTFQSSWFRNYMDITNFFIDTSGRKVYTFKKTVLEGQEFSRMEIAIKELRDKIIPENNKKILGAETYGKDTGISYSTINVNITNNDIDWEKSFFQRTGKERSSNEDEFNKFKTDSQDILANSAVLELSGEIKYYWFYFEGDNSFMNSISNLRSELKVRSDKYQQELTDKLSSKIQEKEGGLGFKPLLKNLIAVVMANTEAFLRLMSDVHDRAWNKKDDPIRRNAIFDSSKSIPSVDSKESVEKTDGNLIPVYPWPQYFVQKNSKEEEPYVLAYPGDSRYVNSTQGYLYNVWPEIEFVEEFLKGRVLYGKGKSSMNTLSNNAQVANRISLNALDFPISNIIFSNKQNTKFLFEIWERVFLYSHFSRFMRPSAEKEISDTIAEVEFYNIRNSVDEDSPELLKLLKEFSFNSGNYIPTLQNISVTSWEKYIRDVFVTEYIQSEVNNSFVIEETTALEPGYNYVQPKLEKIDKLINYLGSKRTNDFNLVDTYPFNNFETWFKNNMASSDRTLFSDLNNTTKVLTYNEKISMITNFSSTTLLTEVRPVTNFVYTSTEIPSVSQEEIKTFYEERFNSSNKKQQPTEGNIVYNDYDGNLSEYQTTSFLNTPYFTNAIQEGVENFKSGNTQTPFVSAAYIFLNSLPLATLREKYKTKSDDTTTDLDYIFSSLNKFGAIHKLPYSWILRYGSIWYRYKNYVNTGIDILDNCWKDFDRVKNFDPISQDVNKTYNFNLNGEDVQIFLENTEIIGAETATTLNVGFYPKVLNDFNFFYKGKDLFSNYTDTEIQTILTPNSGLKVVYGVPFEQNYINNPNNFFLVRTFSCLINKDNNIDYILPSFGSNISQISNEFYDDNGILIKPLSSNSAIFNGSVRTFWALPHFGYFDNSKIAKPKTDEYIKKIISNSGENGDQESFSLRNSEYSSIEELFAVFNRTELDIMENEFLKFCKSKFMYDIDKKTLLDITSVKTTSLPKDNKFIFRNFQNLITEIFSVGKTAQNEFFSFNSEIQEKQFNSATSLIKSFLEYDVLMKRGNPSSFDRKLFDSFSSTPPVDGYLFKPYVLNSLPNQANTTFTLGDYVNLNLSGWKELVLDVGFSSNEKMLYTNTGSTITDFFIDMNIEFTAENVNILSPLIKIYATQKTLNSNYNQSQFKSDIDNYLSDNKKMSDLVLNSLFSQLRTKLPVVSEKEVTNTQTAVQGDQVKLSMWETFKSLNDSWIAGYDFNGTTLFEDFLILDRANRNISEYVFFDPFVVKRNMPGQSDMKTYSVFTFLQKVIQQHNFQVEVMSSYINYYYTEEVTTGKPNSESITQFGNTLFGTFLSVDTKYSSPKIICTALSKPSEHLDNSKNPNYRFNNDIFFLERTNNSLSEDQTDKNDYNKSNKVVAFNVDIGIRNQNIFYNFDVSQDGMKETYASLMNTDNQVKEFNGKKASTQNYSVWDFYKTRSYSCTVRCLGNALLQPGMYFNLRYVPMFYGPYKITSVKHNITPGSFETTFTGMRQSAFSYETINNMSEYLQLLTRQILNDLKQTLSQSKSTDGTTSKQSLTESLNKTNLGDVQSSNNCENLLPPTYKSFVPAQQSATTSSIQNVVDNLIKLFPNDTDQDIIKRIICFVTIYLGSYDGSQFISYNYNYCNLLTGVQNKDTNVAEFKELGGSLSNFIEKKYLCRDLKGRAVPSASFESESKMYEFLSAKWSKLTVNSQLFVDDFVELYYRYWNKNLSVSDFEEFKKKTSDYDSLFNQIDNAIKVAEGTNLLDR